MQERLPAADSPPIMRRYNVKPGAAGTDGARKLGQQQRDLPAAHCFIEGGLPFKILEMETLYGLAQPWNFERVLSKTVSMGRSGACWLVLFCARCFWFLTAPHS